MTKAQEGQDNNEGSNNRKHPRYHTEVEIFYHFDYDLETKVKYEKISKQDESVISQKYSALSKNVSAEGICFISERKLDLGNRLHLEIFLPTTKKPIHMIGDVRWSKSISDEQVENDQFETGIQLLKVGDDPVQNSIYYDKEYRVEWSAVLEAVLGSYRIMAQKRTKEE